MDSLIVFRTDSSELIGTGHVIRCLTLAEQIERKLAEKARESKIVFLSYNLVGNINHLIEQYGFEVSTGSLDEIVSKYENRIDLLIVDHYEIDDNWQSAAREYAINILVIDDLANRKHDADALLDQNYNKDMMDRYQGLVPDVCQLFIGPKHMLFRDEFYDYRKIIDDRTHKQVSYKDVEFKNDESKDKKFTSIKIEVDKMEDKVIKILVFYGGADHTGETIKAINAIQRSYKENNSQAKNFSLKIRVIVGAANQAAREIEEICLNFNQENKEENINYEFHQQVSNMAELLVDSDLALGAGGVTMWERAYLGIPSIVTIIAENQRLTTEAAADLGAVVNAGWHESVSQETLEGLLASLIYCGGAEERRRSLSQASLSLMDGNLEEVNKGNNASLMDWIEEVLLKKSGVETVNED